MLTINRRIAGLNVTIEGESSISLAQLNKELAIYPPTQEKTDILIHFKQQDANKAIANNPSIHKEFEDGFSASFGSAIVRWRWGHAQTLVNWFSPNPPKNWLGKFCGIQFTHPYEQIGQIFFELVLIPTLQLFYYERFLLLHGSALASVDEKNAIVFGGTGGVGKTSLELELVGKQYRFMADDISIVDNNGLVWANFSWPKIYGYNTLGDDSIKTRMFAGRSIVDRFCWHLRMLRYGINRVRRRVDPESFFNDNISQQASLKDYFILFRDHSSELTFTPIDAITATHMSLEVMMSEYSTLYRHLNWHKYNRIGLQQSPFVTIEDIFAQWQQISNLMLKDVCCFLVHLPANLSASDLKTSFPSLLCNYRNPKSKTVDK